MEPDFGSWQSPDISRSHLYCGTIAWTPPTAIYRAYTVFPYPFIRLPPQGHPALQSWWEVSWHWYHVTSPRTYQSKWHSMAWSIICRHFSCFSNIQLRYRHCEKSTEVWWQTSEDNEPATTMMLPPHKDGQNLEISPREPQRRKLGWILELGNRRSWQLILLTKRSLHRQPCLHRLHMRNMRTWGCCASGILKQKYTSTPSIEVASFTGCYWPVAGCFFFLRFLLKGTEPSLETRTAAMVYPCMRTDYLDGEPIVTGPVALSCGFPSTLSSSTSAKVGSSITSDRPEPPEFSNPANANTSKRSLRTAELLSPSRTCLRTGAPADAAKPGSEDRPPRHSLMRCPFWRQL